MIGDKSNDWIGKASCFITFILAIVILCISAFVFHDRNILNYISIFLTALIPLILILLNKKFKWSLPNYIVVLICVHLICSIDLGTVLHFYDKIKWWDLAVHGLFGFIGSSLLYQLIRHFVSRKVTAILFLSIFLMTVGLAGLWEIWEFLVGTITNEDVMRVQESIEAGHSPLFDTMTDMLITMVGVLIFDGVFLFSQYIKKK